MRTLLAGLAARAVRLAPHGPGVGRLPEAPRGMGHMWAAPPKTLWGGSASRASLPGWLAQGGLNHLASAGLHTAPAVKRVAQAGAKEVGRAAQAQPPAAASALVQPALRLLRDHQPLLVAGGAVVAAVASVGVAACESQTGKPYRWIKSRSSLVDEGDRGVPGGNWSAGLQRKGKFEKDVTEESPFENETHGEGTAKPGPVGTAAAPAAAPRNDAEIAPSGAAEVPPKRAACSGWGLILAVMRECILPLTAVVVVTIGLATLTVALPGALGKLYDGARKHGAPSEGANGGSTAALVRIGIIVVAQGALQMAQVMVNGMMKKAMEARLRERVMIALLAQDTEFFDKHHTSAVGEYLTNDVQEICNTIQRMTLHGVQDVVLLVQAAVSMMLVSPKLAAVVLATLPFGTAVMIGLGTFLRQSHKRANKASLAAQAHATQVIGGIRTVRAFGQEKAEEQRYHGVLETAAHFRARYFAAMGVYMGCFHWALGLGMTMWLWYGSRLIDLGELTAGQLTSVVQLTRTIGNSLNGLTNLHKSLVTGLESAERIEKLEALPKLVEGNGCRKLKGLKGHVEFKGIYFAYPTRPDVMVLKDFDLELIPGQVFALVGASGGGKSTIGQMLQRFYNPLEGGIFLDGVPLSELDPVWLRQHIGVVNQEPTLFDGTVADNIRYGCPEATMEEVEAAARKANAHVFIERFPDGYNQVVGERGAQLSGGQRQRIAIARALLTGPSLLLLDEATSALDTESESLVQEALERAMIGRTTLVIAHRLSTVRKADRIGLVQNGKLKEIGTHDELMRKKGEYYKLASHQLGPDALH